MLRRYSMVLALVAVVLAGCFRNDPPDQERAGGEPTQELTAADSCPKLEPGAIVTLAQDVDWSAGSFTDTAKLQKNGPLAEVVLNPTYDSLATYDSGAVIARVRALEPIAYPRMNLSPNGTTYVWAHKCKAQVHVVFISDAAAKGRSPVWDEHPHDYPAGVHIAFRDVTISGAADSLLAAGLVDSLEVDSTRADSTSGDVKFITMQATALCARCKTGGWCTGV